MSRAFLAAGDGPTGADLHEELRAAAAKAGVSIQKFAAPLFNEPNWKLEQLRIAKNPTPGTVARVRAHIAGEPLPPPSRGGRVYFGLSRAQAEAQGMPPSRVSIEERERAAHAIAVKERIEFSRRLTERAHAERLPGETIAAAVRRLRHQDSTIASLGGGE